MIEELSFERIMDAVNSVADEIREFDEDGKAMGCAMYVIRQSLTEDEKDLRINSSRVNAAIQSVRSNSYEYMAGGKQSAERLEQEASQPSYESVSAAKEVAILANDGLDKDLPWPDLKSMPADPNAFISEETIEDIKSHEEGCEMHIPDRSTRDILEDRLYDLKDTYESLGLLMHKMKTSILDINIVLNRMSSDDTDKSMLELKDVVSKIDLRR